MAARRVPLIGLITSSASAPAVGYHWPLMTVRSSSISEPAP